MNKKILYILIAIFTIGIGVIGGTYAYFAATTSSNANALNTESDKFAVIYTGSMAIDEPLKLSLNKDGGLNTEVKIKMDEGSALPKANLFFNVEEITNNLINNNTEPWQKALNWEIYGYNEENTLIYSKTGTFNECGSARTETCTNNSKLYIAENQQLSYEYITYKIYIWLDAVLADNGVVGARIKGTIGAETENFTGHLEQ